MPLHPNTSISSKVCPVIPSPRKEPNAPRCLKGFPLNNYQEISGAFQSRNRDVYGGALFFASGVASAVTDEVEVGSSVGRFSSIAPHVDRPIVRMATYYLNFLLPVYCFVVYRERSTQGRKHLARAVSSRAHLLRDTLPRLARAEVVCLRRGGPADNRGELDPTWRTSTCQILI